MNQPLNKTGEPGAVNPIFLTLKPTLVFSSLYGNLRPVRGFSCSRADARNFYQDHLQIAKDIARQHSLAPDGFINTKTLLTCLGQDIVIPFTFQIKDEAVVLPPLEVAETLIHRKLRQLFN